MIRRPPRSTLFPTRRSSDLRQTRLLQAHPRTISNRLKRVFSGPSISKKRAGSKTPWKLPPRPPPRSEEHTSELQSRLHLVCRLLLEKKKKPYQGPMTVFAAS